MFRTVLDSLSWALKGLSDDSEDREEFDWSSSQKISHLSREHLRKQIGIPTLSALARQSVQQLEITPTKEKVFEEPPRSLVVLSFAATEERGPTSDGSLEAPVSGINDQPIKSSVTESTAQSAAPDTQAIEDSHGEEYVQISFIEHCGSYCKKYTLTGHYPDYSSSKIVIVDTPSEEQQSTSN